MKEECHQNFPIVGSGRFITAPVITEDGDPILDPIVLLEANPDKGPASLPQENGNGDSFKPATGMSLHANALNHANTGTAYSSSMVKEVDKKIIQWKLTLHQIGWLCYYCIIDECTFHLSLLSLVFSF